MGTPRLRARRLVQDPVCLADFVQKRFGQTREGFCLRPEHVGQCRRPGNEGPDKQAVVAALARRERIDHRGADAGRGQHAGGVAVAYLDGRLERRAGLGKAVAYGFAQSGAALKPDERQADEIGGRDLGTVPERMVGW